MLLPHGGKRTEVLSVSQGGDFPVLALQGLRGINSFAVYARKGKYNLDCGQVLSMIPPRKQYTGTL